ncbi:MAG: MurR/RpiR family transcriptional regulator [Coriobacteriaceae bacterium]|nr:MurR/RpiR family transcriptional regulator [Coriobacteriaceae bacterium]
MDLIERMKSQEGNFTESELAVARYVAGHPMDVVGNTVSKVSQLSGLSAAAIVRMCQRMGYSGFSEFRFEMDRQLLSNGTQEDGGTSDGGLLSRFVNINAVQLRKVAEAIDASLLSHVAASLCAAPHVAVWGVDRMYERALQLSAGLMHTGIFNSVTNDTTVMDDVAGILGKGDVCVVVSQKGRDYDAYALLMDAIRENGGEVFFVTVNARSQFISHASNAIVLPSIMNGGRSDLADAQLTIYMYLEILLDEVAYLQGRAAGPGGEAGQPGGGEGPRPEKAVR